MTQIKEELWNEVLAKLEGQLSGPTFETWIKPTRIQALSEQQMILLTDNPFARNWLQKHYLGQITQVAAEILGHDIEVSITVTNETTQAPVPSDASPTVFPTVAAVATTGSDRVSSESSALNSKAVFFTVCGWC